MMTTPSSRARRPAPRRLWDGAAALAAAGLLTAAVLTAAQAAPAATAAAITARITPIAWHACPAAPSLDCTTYPVPLDYADRADGTVDLALYRRPATDPAHRIGALFVNPGGPGDSTFKMTERSSRPTTLASPPGSTSSAWAPAASAPAPRSSVSLRTPTGNGPLPRS